MPPRPGSRYLFCKGIRDESGRLYLTEREPFRYRPYLDNRFHTVAEGDTLFDLAGRYFAPLDRACGYWWVIADFQPDPIIDPTIPLELGRQIYVPSLRTLDEEILSESRRRSVGG